MIKFLDLLSEMAIPKGKWEPIPSSEIENFDDEIFDLISTAYAPIGGHPNYKSPKDVTSAEEYEVIDLDSDPGIDAVSVSKDKPAGKKFVATGHDGSSQAKSKLVNHKAELLKRPGHYIEVSGKIKHILLAKGVEPITDEETVRKILQGKEIEWLGDGEYKRSIGGETHTKMLLGRPKIS